MSVWFNLKGKTYTDIPPVSWLKQYVEYLTDKQEKDLKEERTLRETEFATLSQRLDETQLAAGEDTDSLTWLNATATAPCSVAFGEDSSASGHNSLVFGSRSVASGQSSVAIGTQNTASGLFSFAAGGGSTAEGIVATALGKNTVASGISSTATGSQTTAKGSCSFAAGEGTVATASRQFVMGGYNLEDTIQTYALIVGIGRPGAPANGFTVDWKGNGTFAGTLSAQDGLLASENLLNQKIGDIDTALDSILAIQEALIGGVSA